MPVNHPDGDPVQSGVVNAGHPFELVATTTADASTYSGIDRMVAAAEASSAPLVRLADEYAGIFLLLTFTLAAIAWVVSGQPVRALAVLVVATPCTIRTPTP